MAHDPDAAQAQALRAPALAGTAFARTKLQPPRVRAGTLIERPTLEARFAGSLTEHRVVLVCAPAGYGKSSLLARQMAALPSGMAMAWVGCDSDDTPMQLLECLVAALEPYDLPWRSDPMTLMANAAAAVSRDAARAIVAEIINALDACDVPHGLIVVDDFHRVRHPLVFQFLELLLERFTPRWTMVIASREEPPIPLARLRAEGELAEFRAADLRFEPAETHQLAARAGLDAEAADRLHANTDGWPVGLRLALDLQRGGISRGQPAAPLVDRRVFDFLAAEVLDRLEPALRDFLLPCSLLTELTATRCAALTGDEHAMQRLEAIDRAGLFVTPLDGPEPAWRLHDLFRAALEQQLRREQPHAMARLLQRAAASEPDPTRRIAYLLQAQDWTAAAAELRAQGPGLITSGAIGTVLALIERFPSAVRDDLPDLLLTLAITGWATWNWPLMQRSAHQAAVGYRALGLQDHALEAMGYEVVAQRAGGQRAAAQDTARALEAAVAQQPGPRAWQHEPVLGNEPAYVAQALLLLDRTWDAFDEGRLHELPSHLAAQMDLLDHSRGADSLYRSLPLPLYVGLAGMRQPMLHYVHRVLARTDRLPGELRTLARGLLGHLKLWSGDVDGAIPELAEAADETRWRDHPLRMTVYVLPPLMLAHALRGDRAGLLHEHDQLQRAVQRVAGDPVLGSRLTIELFTVARWLLCGGCHDEARALLISLRDRDATRERLVLARQRQALDGYLAWLDGDAAGALSVFEPLLDDPAFELLGLRSELRLRTAQLRLSLGHGTASAAAALEPLFTRHAGDADIAATWVVGPALLHDLSAADWGDSLPAMAQRTLLEWTRRAAALRSASAAAPPCAAESPAQREPSSVAMPAPTAAASPQATDALSAREWEVLARLAAGDSNKLIARAFDLSPHTVKRHVANILDKLGLASRGQAAAWHRQQAG